MLDIDTYRDMRKAKGTERTQVKQRVKMVVLKTTEPGVPRKIPRKKFLKSALLHFYPRSCQWTNQRVHRPTNTSARGIDSARSEASDNTESKQ